MIAVALSLFAAAAYGAADFCGGLASRRTATTAVVVWSQTAGFVALAIALPILGGVPSAADAAWGAATGLCGAGAIVLLYRGLAIGTMGVVSPITAVLAALLPVGVAMARGDRPGALTLGGIVAALIAVVLVSASPPEAGARDERPRTRAWLPAGIPEALGAGACFGFMFVALAQTRSEAGLSPLLIARIVSIAIVGGWAAIAGGRQLHFTRRAAAIIVMAGTLDMAANVLYVLAAHRGSPAIAAVLTSLYPAATVALAALVLRERLGRQQWIGVGVAVVAVAAIAAK